MHYSIIKRVLMVPFSMRMISPGVKFLFSGDESMLRTKVHLVAELAECACLRISYSSVVAVFTWVKSI